MTNIPGTPGCTPTNDQLIDLELLESKYYTYKPSAKNPQERVSFGTSGHRGSAMNGTFTSEHVKAISYAIVMHRQAAGITGPIFVGADTHALSALALKDCIKVLQGFGAQVVTSKAEEPLATPVISRSIIHANSNTKTQLSDGIIITPSHNPPADGGIKYNPPNGGPAGTEITKDIETRANLVLGAVPTSEKSSKNSQAEIRYADITAQYVEQLSNVIDMSSISRANIKIGVDPLGGATLRAWNLIAKRYDLQLTVVNNAVDPTFKFMRLDHDSAIRMDCSSPFAMAGLVELKDKFDISIGNDPDGDRHGIVTPQAGLLNPNHFLAVAIDYLCKTRKSWNPRARIGKTVVSSSIIDDVVRANSRALFEVPVGFKWFAPGLADGSLVFGGEESAGASFSQLNGGTWVTEKDGIILGLLAAEIRATTGKDPASYYDKLAESFGRRFYARIDSPLDATTKKALSGLKASSLPISELAGAEVVSAIDSAPGNNASIGGLKISTKDSWIAVRPSGTEPIVKLYAESRLSAEHLSQTLEAGKNLLKAISKV